MNINLHASPTLPQFMWNGLKDIMPGMAVPPDGTQLNLGSGNTRLRHTGNCPPENELLDMDRPSWEAPLVNTADGTIAAVHMYHFLEHLSSDEALAMLMEVDRILMPGGVAYIVVPHAGHELAYQAIDHRTFYTEETFQDLFYSPYYTNPVPGFTWSMDIITMFVAGIKTRNMCVFVQLVKRPHKFNYTRYSR